MDLESTRALVTGSSSGIGEATAVALAEGGADVAVHYAHNREGAEATAKGVEEAGGEAPVLQADLSEPEAAWSLAEEAREALGRVDVLVNNAGTIDDRGDGPLGSKPFDERAREWDHVMGVNLRAPWILAADLAPRMRDRGEGAVVNVASVSGWTPQTEVPLYSLSKAGLVHETRLFAAEFAPEVRVNAVAPGWIPTSFGWGHLETEAFRETIAEEIPMDRMGEPEEIGEAVRFLVAEATYTTGEVLGAAGGLEAQVG